MYWKLWGFSQTINKLISLQNKLKQVDTILPDCYSVIYFQVTFWWPISPFVFWLSGSLSGIGEQEDFSLCLAFFWHCKWLLRYLLSFRLSSKGIVQFFQLPNSDAEQGTKFISNYPYQKLVTIYATYQKPKKKARYIFYESAPQKFWNSEQFSFFNCSLLHFPSSAGHGCWERLLCFVFWGSHGPSASSSSTSHPSWWLTSSPFSTLCKGCSSSYFTVYFRKK